MSKVKDTKAKLQSKLEAIKKINDNPKSLTDNIADKYLKDLPTSDILGKKLDGFLKKSSKKESKKDIFAELIEIAEGFLTKPGKVESNDKSFSKGRLKSHGINATMKTVESTKEIVLDSVKNAFFANGGICGTQLTLTGVDLQLKPQEFDFLNVLTVNPLTPIGKILYENNSGSKAKVNKEMYTIFSGGTYQLDTNNNNTLFSMSWDQTGQYFNITNFSGKHVEDFFNEYYSSIELPDTKKVVENAMLLTLQGGEGGGKQFDASTILLNRLLKKLFSVCGSEKDRKQLKNQNPTDLFDEKDEDIESYFDFDDMEGIDVDSETSKFQKVLIFRDCDNFETPINPSTISDFVYFGSKKSINELVDSTLMRTSTQAYLDSGSDIPQINFNINLINNFILNLPKAIIGALLSPKMFLPIVIVFKIVKSLNGQVVNIKSLMKTLHKLFYDIISTIFWRFIREFWTLVKIDLITMLGQIIKKIIKRKYERYLTIIKSLISFLLNVLNQKIDNCYGLFNAVIDAVNSALSTNSPFQIPGFMLLLSEKLPGYSQDRALVNIIERLEAAGVDTGPVFGESSNLTSLIKSIIDGHTEETDQNSYVKISLKGGVIPGPTGGAVIPPGLISGVGKMF